ncbi:MAG TPA: EAL domain-containing protein [Solirubrobacterales bacterium]|nr:EAL domain-containing protein [Solirubrobacterales bacterium]
MSGLLSRGEFDRVLAGTLARTPPEVSERAVFMVDVRGVARISRALGYPVSDELLAEVGARLAATAGSSTVTNHGEDRFVILCENLTDRGEVTELARRLVEAVRMPRLVSGLRVRLVASVGAAVPPRRPIGGEEVMREAAAAAAAAAKAGPNRFEVFYPDARPTLVSRLRLEDELCLALERDELEAHFQPIVDAAGGQLMAIEALLRWRHPERGLIPPDRFLPVAEETGLITDLGDWILTEVCARIARWQIEDPDLVCPPVSVNISMSQLCDVTLAGQVSAALAAAGVPPSSLLLEITESAAMELKPAPLEALAELKRIGVGVLLDDFGTGYSSLSWLSWLPVDGVKVDRAFLSHVTAPSDPVPILTAVTQIGKDLGLTVIAEGVETAEQLAAVRAVGVDWMQGYHVARPAPADTAADLRDLLARALSVSSGAGREATDDELVGIGAVAELLGMSVSSARRVADSGALPSVRTEGGHRRFERRVLERFSRERLGEPSLAPRRLPAKPLRDIALLLRSRGPELLDQTRQMVYARPGGWFSTAHGRSRSDLWLDSLADRLAEGGFREAIETTTHFLDTAVAAGASVAECVRFLGQFAQVVAQHVQRSGDADPGEARDVQRLTAATIESFLERR